ncbi:putative FAD-dependent oxidoreductase [Escherichia coli]|uniref:Protein FixC n=1 Tax=Escherichia coli TaxID=562 RepID=A0A2X3JSG4_ECOLX|nr:putative FAD-dependent oxidoreductase [Escherichia coli]
MHSRNSSPQFHLTAPLERRITHESLSLLTPDGATTFSSLQPGGESWSVLRARFDPWLVAEAEEEGVECIPERRWMHCMKKTAGCVCHLW